MNTQRIKLLLVFGLMIQIESFAQQRNMYTQYMFNGLAINPAYAGSTESLSLTALARKQWVGINGSPSSQTFAGHSPIKNDKVGIGILLNHDKIGVTNQYLFNLAYAYRIKVGAGKLSLGLQGGFSNYSQTLTALYLGPNTVDPSFSSDVQGFTPNVGAGLYYYTKKFYFGFSSPQLITYNNTSSEQKLAKQARHYFVNTGYVFKISNSLKLKPGVLVKMVEGAPVQMDINANLFIKEVLWVGGSYRTGEAASALIQLQLTDQLRFGYSYDFPAFNSLGRMNSGSHELMLNYSFTYYKTRFVSPRYF